jgi:two-component system cell cycle response regulator
LPLSIVLFDLDEFKSINDRYGHAAGDAVLVSVGQRLAKVLRRSDVRCRYGGDEFLVILPETPVSGAARVGELLRAEIEQIVVAIGAERVTQTISIGAATVEAGGATASALIARADEALYRAKAQGRNCVRLAGDRDFDRERSLDTVPVITTH